MVTPASRTTAVLLGFLNRAQKFGVTGPCKNFDFLFNRLLTAGFRNFS